MNLAGWMAGPLDRPNKWMWAGLLLTVLGAILSKPIFGAEGNQAQTAPIPSETRGFKRVQEEQRLALVIGNQTYEESPLRNPVNDARALKVVLETLGFQVIYRENADQSGMEEAVREFGRRLGKDSVGLFYYSGHGVQADGNNYLIPVQARIASKTELRNRALDVGVVFEAAEQAGTRVTILILDACRDNPFKGFRSGTNRGLTALSGPVGSLIAYATAPGGVAADGGGANGLYTKHLLRFLAQPGLTVEAMFKSVREAVVEESQGGQVPWENTSLKGEFCFAGCSALAKIETQPVTPTVSPTPPTAPLPPSVAAKPLAPQPIAGAGEKPKPKAPSLVVAKSNPPVKAASQAPPRFKPAPQFTASQPKAASGGMSARCRGLLERFQDGMIGAGEYRRECGN